MFKKIFEMTKKQKIIILTSCLVGLITIITGTVFLLNNKEEEQKICTIIFNTNGGTQIKSKEIDCKTKIKKPEDPSKEGFDFIGWYYKEEKFDFKTIITRDMTLEAKYEKQEGIETVFITLDTGTENKNIIEIKKGSLLEQPEDPILKGYVFEGWYIEYERFDFNTPINENIELTAKFVKKESNVNISSSNDNNKNSKYKCSGSFRTDVPVKNVTIGYQDHVNWTWSTYGISGGETAGVCYYTYKTSDSSIASVSDKGIIKALKSGTAYIYSCINDTETKDELICFKGKLNIIDEYDNQTVLTEQDKIVNKYVGMWYLEGYADIYLDIKKYKNYGEYMSIYPHQFNIETGEKYPSGYGDIAIHYSNWDNDLRKYGITLSNDKIIIETGNNKYTFTRTKGTKDQYTGKLFHKILGKWYLFNNPESYIEVDFNNGRYCIQPYKFDLNTLSTQGWSTGSRCDNGRSDKLINDLGIKVENDILTITNSHGTAKLYKTKKVIEVESITINKKNLELLKGHEETLIAQINPTDAYYKDIIWTSSNPSIASVDSNGKVTAISKGKVVITASSKDGKKSAQCNVTVTYINVDGITLNKNNLTIIKGTTEYLSATISPSNASNTKYSWTSSDPSVATVDSNGKITAIKKGTATITVTTEDGNHQANCTVEVTNPQLYAEASIGLSLVTTSSGMYRGIKVTINASGGSENYTYFNIKLYRDGTLIGQSQNTYDNEIFVVGFTSGNYTAEFEVKDSENNVYRGTKSTQVSAG